jgi:ATP-binding cassette subfamily C protein CydC
LQLRNHKLLIAGAIILGTEPIIPSARAANHSGDLLSRLVSDVETLQNLYLRVASLVVVAAMVVYASTWILWFLNAAAGLASVFTFCEGRLAT